jgi:hypothetical protein
MNDTSLEQTDVFVSYSHADAELALPIIDDLRNQGVRLWFDEARHPDSSWSQNLADKILEAKLLLFLGTNNSAAADLCATEIGFALDNNTKVLPVFLEATVMPNSLQARLDPLKAIQKHELAEPDFQSKLQLNITEILQAPAATIDDSAAKPTGPNVWMWIYGGIALIALIWTLYAYMTPVKSADDGLDSEIGDEIIEPIPAASIESDQSIHTLTS